MCYTNGTKATRVKIYFRIPYISDMAKERLESLLLSLL